MKFILQSDKNGHLASEPNTVRELIDTENAWYNSQNHSYSCISGIHAGLALHNEIPVGSVEFCNACAAQVGAGRLPALNVPPVLRGEYITGRKCFDFTDEHELIDALQTVPNGLVVKPGDYAKRFDAFKVGRAEYIDLRDKPGPYFASEYVAKDIEAEWRVFFYRGEIVGARPYLMHSWCAPTDLFAKLVLKEWGENAPKAGTLDIAILAGGRNILLEAHPMIACGFYGFEDQILLRMLRDAWVEQVTKGVKHGR